jgi:hypothetical protein
MKIKNNYEALVVALKLGITAQTEEQASRIEKHIRQLVNISGLEDIELAKAQVAKELYEESGIGDQI